jgi:hypothetical protein
MTTTSSDDAPRRLPNEPIQETLTGGEGVRDTLDANLEQQKPGAKLSDAEGEYNKRAGVGQVREGDGSPVNPYSDIPRPGDADDFDPTPLADQT